MAIGLVMQFKGVKPAQYDAVMKELGLSWNQGDWPEGIISHAAGQTADGICVVDIWKSQAQFDSFMKSRLGPAIERSGGMPAPQITTFEVRNTWKHG